MYYCISTPHPELNQRERILKYPAPRPAGPSKPVGRRDVDGRDEGGRTN